MSRPKAKSDWDIPEFRMSDEQWRHLQQFALVLPEDRTKLDILIARFRHFEEKLKVRDPVKARNQLNKAAKQAEDLRQTVADLDKEAISAIFPCGGAEFHVEKDGKKQPIDPKVFIVPPHVQHSDLLKKLESIAETFKVGAARVSKKPTRDDDNSVELVLGVKHLLKVRGHELSRSEKKGKREAAEFAKVVLRIAAPEHSQGQKEAIKRAVSRQSKGGE